MPEAMVFGTDIFAICDKLGLVVTCDEKSSVKELFEKQRVGVDALNTSHHAGRQGPLSWAERRRNLGQRIVGLWLKGAVPVIIIDGPETAPGAGTYSQIEARARAHRKRVRDAAFPRRILDAKSAPKALEWASGLFGGNLLPKKGEPGYAKIVQKFRDVRKLYDDDSD